MRHPRPIARRRRSFLIGPLVLFVLGAAMSAGAFADSLPRVSATAPSFDGTAGSQGLDTSLPITDSPATAQGRGPFASLQISVNQTKNLTNQAISINWSGGIPTNSGRGKFTANFLQIFQCWGDDDGTVPGNPGPPPEQCEQGAAYASPTGPPATLFSDGVSISRIISNKNWANYDPNVGVSLPNDNNVWLPFKAVDGTVVNVQTDSGSEGFWGNPFFNSITTNEIPGAATSSDGTGAELFQVLTGNEASGLGCGRKVEPIGNSFRFPKCWLVVVPRGDQTMENVGTASEAFGSLAPVATSPVSPAAWAHRIAVPLEFKPVDASCPFSGVERRIAGNQMALPAVTSWQPVLCTGANPLPPFVYAPVSDSTARSLVGSTTQGAPGMAVVSRPVRPDTVPPDKPLVYSPLSVSGLVIGFNIERVATIGADSELPYQGQRISEIRLTPRLVAKLLTQSYGDAVSIVRPPPYPWLQTNPANISLDPDFLQFNPEFKLLYIPNGKTMSTLQLPIGNSDAARQIWEWVLADPEAKAWMSGRADKWGMTINPMYSTKASANPTGQAFGVPVPDSFPKADPYCYQGPAQGPGGTLTPPALCTTDWTPYSRDFGVTAQVARRADDGSKVINNPLAENTSQIWKSNGPQLIGSRSMLSVTDTPSATQFGLQVASLSRAGDNGTTRTFTTPSTGALVAALPSMKSASVAGFLEPQPLKVAANAYPLTSLTYAAVSPLSLDTKSRSDFAKFLAYATTTGQRQGLGLGQLPPGYAPLPASLQTQAAKAVSEITTMKPVPTSTTSTSSTTTSTSVVTTTSSIVHSPTTYPQGGGGGDVSGGGDTTSTAATIPATQAPTTTVAPVPSSTTTTTTTVAASGPVTTVLTNPTPSVTAPNGRFAVAGFGLMSLASALGVLEITKHPRKSAGSNESLSDGFDDMDGVT